MPKAADTLLKTYREKRDFSRTSEPAGGASRGEDLAFVVQKHDATRLHYDFRIEWDGVLKSWAVTRGPSLDPADKRLAVRVEDHPLDYGSFEGTIPEGEYGGGTVMLWDRGSWEPQGDPEEAIKRGSLKMVLHGEKMRGHWALVRMKGKSGEKRENWLLIKEKDEEAHLGEDILRQDRSVSTGRDLDEIAKNAPSRKTTASPTPAGTREPKPKVKAEKASAKSAAIPEFRPVQLALLTDTAPTGDAWLHEVKYDGYRVLIAIGGGAVRFYTRNEQDWTERFQSLQSSALALPCKSALIDGEVVAFDETGRTDFSSLQKALTAKAQLSCFCFDLLELNGEDLTGHSLVERKNALEKLLAKNEGHLLFSQHVRGNGPAVFAGICKGGQEGIVSKRADASYVGARNGEWLKTKCTRRQEFVIGGFSPSDKAGRPFASILVGVREDGAFLYRGRVGSGFDEESLAELAERFEDLSAPKSPFADLPRPIAKGARFVKPRLVAEVDFTELTADGQIRHGVFKGLREDKSAEAVVDETKSGASESSVKAKPKTETKTKTPAGDGSITIAGVRVTHPDRIVFEGQGISKGDLARYYEAVAERMLGHAGNRPVSLVRCPSGGQKHCFFQKHASSGFPEALGSVHVTEKDGDEATYMSLSDAASIVAAIQMGAMEFHIWGSRNDDLEKPDRLVFDLDPDPSVSFTEVRKAAELLRDGLETLGLKTFPMVTGGKGVHIVAPLGKKATADEVANFAKHFAERVVASDPKRFVATMSKEKRKKRIFIDWLRNERGQTAVAPYSTRSREGAPVATPVSWKELAKLKGANTFTLDTVLERLAEPDPWEGYGSIRQNITARMIAAVEDRGE